MALCQREGCLPLASAYGTQRCRIPHAVAHNTSRFLRLVCATFGTRLSVVDNDGAAPSTKNAESNQSSDSLGLVQVVRLAGCETAWESDAEKTRSNMMSVASDRRILTLLVRARMSLRRQRRDSSFYHRLAQTGRNPKNRVEVELSALFPPRREWPRPGLPARRSAIARGLDPVSSTLVDWLLSRISKPKRESPAWLRRLRRFVGSVRRRIRDWAPDDSFEKPKIYAVLKSRALERGQADTFRCLATYSLRDRIVISLAARYLRETTDSLMHSGSLAFRTQRPPPTHHDAVERIMRFRQDHYGKTAMGRRGRYSWILRRR